MLVREEGRAPEDVAAQTRQLLQNTMKKFRQRALVAAREEHEREQARFAAIKCELPKNPKERRQLLDALIAQHQQAGQVLTAQHRDFAEMTDEDVESWLQQFGALGLLNAKPDSNQ